MSTTSRRTRDLEYGPSSDMKTSISDRTPNSARQIPGSTEKQTPGMMGRMSLVSNPSRLTASLCTSNPML